MKSVHVGDEVLQLPAGLFETDNSPHKGTIVDSGTTFTYLPDALFKPLVKKVYKCLLFLSVSFILRKI